MSIFINGTQLNNLDDLSPATQTILQMIDCGQSWLNRSIDNNSTKKHFSSESNLLTSILKGFYNTQLLTISSLKLTVGIDKLLTINANVLRDLYNYSIRIIESKSACNNTIQSEINRLLENNKLVDNTALDITQQKAIKKGISSENFLSSMDINVRLKLNKLLTETTLTQQKKTQIVAASSQANNLAQNANGYISLLESQLILNDRELEQSAQPYDISVMLNELTPLFESHLECPQINMPPDQLVLDNTIKNWINNKMSVGFSDIYSALNQFIKVNKTELAESNSYEKSLNNYVATFQKCITASQANDAEVLQDGKTWFYYYDNQIGKATLAYSPDGYLSLHYFQQAD
jgi:hypothetical protein